MTKQITKELITKFRKYLEEGEKASATIEKYVRDINAFLRWIGRKAVDKQVVLEYKNHLMEIYAPTSVNSVISSLNSFFEFNSWHDVKTKVLKIPKRIFADRDKELTKSEYERLLAAAKTVKNHRLYYLMQTICSTGIRVSEDI